MKNRFSIPRRVVALLLVVLQLFYLSACGKKDPAEESSAPTVAPTEPQAPDHVHVFADGLCECGQNNGFDGVRIEAENASVTREDTESSMRVLLDNVKGAVCLASQANVVSGQYYEQTYVFTSDVAGKVRFVCDGVLLADSEEYEVKAGKNEIAVRFAADQVQQAKPQLVLGELGKCSLEFTKVGCKQLAADFNGVFLDVAPEKAKGSMEETKDGLKLSYNTEESWRVKLAVDRSFKKGKIYEAIYVFTTKDTKSENVTYLVYDNVAASIGAKTCWVDKNVCLAVFYVEAKETATKGTCLEVGNLSGGKDVEMLVTYAGFREVSKEKAEKLLADNPFLGVGVWTDGSLSPAQSSQSKDGLKLVNSNAATDWWKVKLEMPLDCKSGRYYRITFGFESNASGTIKFVNDDATYYGSNEFDVRNGKNEFSVEIKSGGNSYSCLELGGLGAFELLFTNITVEEIKAPTKSALASNEASDPSSRFGSFNVWNDSSVGAVSRADTATTLTINNPNAPTDWWKVKLEKDIACYAGLTYEVVYSFTSNVEGRIKFFNEDAQFFGNNEYDVSVGYNTFRVKFRSAGKPYSCLELGSLGYSTLVFTDYSIMQVSEPTAVKNGFENFKVWTDGSVKLVDREDTATSMILSSPNAPTDWWKVKLEGGLDLKPGKTYKVTYEFTSNVAGDIKFGTNETVYCQSADVFAVKTGKNVFTVKFTVGAEPYVCLELGGLGKFKLEFTKITLKEVKEDVHTHFYVNGTCSCGLTNAFTAVSLWTEDSLAAATRQDTASSMIVKSNNPAGDWWKVKVEPNFTLKKGKTYKATFVFNSDVSGMIKFNVDDASYGSANEYTVKKGANTFTVKFTVGGSTYHCLELGGLGAFTLTFTKIAVQEVDAPHTHNYIDGTCSCGLTNAFTAVHVWTEGSLTPATRKDTATSMTVKSTNAAGDWWKVKVEPNFVLNKGKTYEAKFVFNSDVSGTIKFNVDGAAFIGANEYEVKSGANTFTAKFTVGDSTYHCLELGGLGKFTLTFTEISIADAEAPHIHSFVNGVCVCGETNGFEAVNVWSHESVNPVTREDDETSMTIKSTNAADQWWKVKVEPNFALEKGKTYEATFVFTSDVAGTIKFNVEGASYDGADVYDVQVGENTFTTKFTVGDSIYHCLELGGLDKFTLTFTEISIADAEAPHIHSFVNGVCECGLSNGFAGVNVWTDGSVNPVTREDDETSMTIKSTNAADQWWKVKVEPNFALEKGKTYEAKFAFTSDVAGTIKFNVDGASYDGADVYDVVVGENTFTTKFTVGESTYHCLELGGLDKFTLTFTEISIADAEAPHIHSFVNGVCECGLSNGFAGVNVWSHESVNPVTREDDETSMTIKSTNAAGEWWKVKVEPNFALEKGKTYEAAFNFTSDVTGTIKFNVDGATYDGKNVHDVQVGENTFTVKFTVGDSTYHCLELGDLGAFILTFTSVLLSEVA